MISLSSQGKLISSLPWVGLSTVVPTMPDTLLESKALGVIYDEVEGMYLLPDFRIAQEAFETPDPNVDDRHREAVLGFLESPEVPPLPLRRLSNRNPQSASRAFSGILDRPSFSWKIFFLLRRV